MCALDCWPSYIEVSQAFMAAHPDHVRFDGPTIVFEVHNGDAAYLVTGRGDPLLAQRIRSRFDLLATPPGPAHLDWMQGFWDAKD